MSSTPSSRNSSRNAATEALASRYRHLFVLPSTQRLLLYVGAVSLAISLLSSWSDAATAFALSLSAAVLSAAAVSGAIRLEDKRSFASFRRTLAVVLAGGVLWSMLVLVGAAYAWTVRSSVPLTNVYLYGAFVCTGLEYLIIYGVFTRKSALSIALAVIHPASTLFILRYAELSVHLDPIALISGVLSLGVIFAFPLLLKRSKTSLGYDALQLFQAFMKTWTAGDAGDLEEIIAAHSEVVEVETEVFRFRTSAGDTFLVLPGVHPGPFHPVGSYDLPGVISREFRDLGRTMTLHRPGGHERNLATRADTQKYASELKELAKSIPSARGSLLHGPIRSRVGKAAVSALSFSDDMLLTISFAPLGSDDLDTRVETDLSRQALEAGFDASVVDAHNSIAHDLETPETMDPGWKELFRAVRRAAPEAFDAGYAHSSEVGFSAHSDITENGIALFMLRSRGSKFALILADANNAVPTLKAQVAAALESAGYTLIELCTSDSHNLAARGLTVERGYEALGEATPATSIAELGVKLARLADSRLAPAEYGSTKKTSKVKVFGSKALEEFATITQSSSRFSSRYLRFAVAATAALLVMSMVA
ncbi:MAG: DUF2070 family protein [Nitrososphaerota archaeon]|nr:DUF2070 family protein [Nitrososphaerota archaeon]